MEIHQAHHVMHKKKWNEYLLEFFMLFLAVFLGFIAENWRENMIENQHEKQLMLSFLNDMKKDIHELDSLIKKREVRESEIDSLNFILQTPDPDLYGRQLYYYARYLPRPYNFVSNDATFQQLKYSGGLRLIHKREVADTILDYDRQVHFIDYIRDREEELIQRIFPYIDELFDPVVFNQMNIYDIEFNWPPGNPKLLTKDKKILQRFMSEIHYLKTVNIGQIGWFKKQQQRAEVTFTFIQKEYHLENE